MIEYARNIAGIVDAGHAEYDPNDPNPLIVAVACPVEDRPADAPSLYGRLKIAIAPGTLAARVLGQREIEEQFTCSFELRPDAEAALVRAGLVISGRGEHGEVRLVELPEQRYYLASLFLPQFSSSPDAPHPMVVAFVQAAGDFRPERRRIAMGTGE